MAEHRKDKSVIAKTFSLVQMKKRVDVIIANIHTLKSDSKMHILCDHDSV